MSKLLVAGSLAFDYIMDFPGHFKDHILPEKLHIINISFLVEKLTKQRGGCAANIAYTLSLLGEKPRLIGSAGNDFASYRDYLDELGIDTSTIRISEDDSTATAFITTDQSDNQINGFYVGAMTGARDISMAECKTAESEWVIVAPDDPKAMERHCEEAKQAGLKVLYDPSFQVSSLDGELLLKGLDGAWGLFLNDYEYEVLQEKTGKTSEQLLEKCEHLVVTLGEKGSKIMTRDGKTLEVGSAAVKEVVDPTGAGDAFRGGFMAGLSRGSDLEACARLGAVAAAYAVENYGTQNHFYSPEDFATRHKDAFGVAP